MKKTQIREWLNKDSPNLTAYIMYDSDEGTVKIADCSRRIELEFCIGEWSNIKQLDRTDAKIDLLYDTIKEIRKDIKKRTRRHRKDKVE